MTPSKIAEITGLIAAITGLITAVVVLLGNIEKRSEETPKLSETYYDPRHSGLRIDICSAKDDKCIKEAKDHGGSGAKAWCGEHGYYGEVQYSYKEATNIEAWRLGGDGSDKCDGQCKYFSSITCYR